MNNIKIKTLTYSWTFYWELLRLKSIWQKQRNKSPPPDAAVGVLVDEDLTVMGR